MQFEIISQLLESDYIEINKELKKIRERKSKWFNIIMRIFVFFVGLILIIFSSSYQSDFFVGLLFLLFSLFYEPFIDFIRLQTYKKVYNSSFSMKEITKYNFFEDSVRKSSDSTNTEIKWNAFTEVLEIDNYFLLMTSKVSFLPILKKEISKEQEAWLKSKTDQTALRSL